MFRKSEKQAAAQAGPLDSHPTGGSGAAMRPAASPRPPPLTREQIRSMLDNAQRLRALHEQERGRKATGDG